MDPWKPNTTVAAIIERDGRFLMVEEHTPEGLRLNQPAGHLDPGESLVQAVEREALEETAHQVQAQALVGVYMSRYQNARDGVDVTYLRFAFACQSLAEVSGRALDTGIVRAVWMSPQEIRLAKPMHRSPLVGQSLEDHLAGRRYPLDLIFTHDSCLFPRS
jgi:8-oxo-dGTP pyrophosphatase MutT (NUDIX family)